MKLFDTYTADVVELVTNYTANRRRKEAAKAEERGVAARAEERFERAMLALEDIDVIDVMDALEERPAGTRGSTAWR